MLVPQEQEQIPCGEIFEGVDLVQVFTVVDVNLTVIAPVLATYAKSLNCQVTMRLFELPAEYGFLHLAHPARPPDLSALKAIVERTFANPVDNAAVNLFLEPLALTKGRLYALEITSADASRGAAPTAWLHRSREKLRGHLRCFYGGVDQGEFGLMATVVYASATASAGVPQFLNYSPVTQCNLNCIHCISRDTRSAKHVLCRTVKDDIRTWCEQGRIRQIATDYSGDILWADHKFGGELDFLIGLGVPLHIDTNGVHLTAARSERLMNSKLISLNVSLDAGTNPTFQRIRKGAPSLESVLDNVARFAALRKRLRPDGAPSLSLGFTLMRSNLLEWTDCIRNAAAVGADAVVARHIEAYTPDMHGESLAHDPDLFNAVRAEAVALAKELRVELCTEPEMPRLSREPDHRICTTPWESALILGNGDVMVCCVPKTAIGNLYETSLEDIWNGPAYAAFRKRVNSADPPAQCKACGMKRTVSNLDSYLPYQTIADWTPPRDWPLN